MGAGAPPADRILIVRTEHEPFDHVPYVIHLLSEEWRKRGVVHVDATDRLTEAQGPEVLVFPHLDLTKTPPPLREMLDRSARVINRAVTDISKRVISRHLVAAPGDYDGAVIVKTDRNFGGLPEAKAAVRKGGMQRRKVALMRRLPWTISGFLERDGYRVYDRPGLVPRAVWSNPALVVEKFLPERDGDFYCLRQYIFLGSCEVNTRSVSTHPLVKARNVVRREILEETPAAVREFRARLGFDYGKFDYVMHSGEPIVFDVNRTPSYDRASKTGSAASLMEKLAPGIVPFLAPA